MKLDNILKCIPNRSNLSSQKKNKKYQNVFLVWIMILLLNIKTK